MIAEPGYEPTLHDYCENVPRFHHYKVEPGAIDCKIGNYYVVELQHGHPVPISK